MKRRVGTILATIALLGASTACGGNLTQGSTDNGEVPGVTEDSIKIGTTLPLTGGAAVAGMGFKAGLEMAVDEVNGNGGVNGRELELVVLDDGYVASRTISNMRRLVDQEDVYAIVGPAGSASLPGSWQFIAESNTPVWGPKDPPDPQQQQVYILSATRNTQVQVAVDYFADQGLSRIALIGEDSDIGAQAQEALEVQVPKHTGMSLVASEVIELGTTNVSAAVNAAAAANPDVVIVAAQTPQVSLTLRELRNQGVEVPVYADGGAAGTGGVSTVEPAGNAANGLLGGLQIDNITTNNPDLQRWRELAEAYQGEQALSGFSLQTYNYVLALVELLERLDGDYSYESFYEEADSLEADPIDLGVLPPIQCGSLPEGHTCIQEAGIAEYNNGEWSVVLEFTSAQ